nr:ISAs1 family transposase [Nostoc punctiforme]
MAQSLGFKDVNVNIIQRVEKGHHRIENRQVYTMPVSKLPGFHEQDLWAGLTTVVMVVRSIRHWNQTTQEVQFYITSLASDAHKIGSAIRQHWGIENSVHWTLDVTFNEDECRIRSLHSPQNNAKATSHCPQCLRARIIFPSQYSPKVSASRDE